MSVKRLAAYSESGFGRDRWRVSENDESAELAEEEDDGEGPPEYLTWSNKCRNTKFYKRRISY